MQQDTSDTSRATKVGALEIIFLLPGSLLLGGLAGTYITTGLINLGKSLDMLFWAFLVCLYGLTELWIMVIFHERSHYGRFRKFTIVIAYTVGMIMLSLLSALPIRTIVLHQSIERTVLALGFIGVFLLPLALISSEKVVCLFKQQK